MRRLTIIIMFLLLSLNYVAAQGVVGIKTNLLYGGVTFTPNLGVEIGLGKRTTLDMAAKIYPQNIMQFKSWNNLGEISMIEGDYESAYQYFQKTIDMGNIEAARNIEELNKKKVLLSFLILK